MFQKKEIIYSETMGVCRVDDVTSLLQNKIKPVSYYVLKSVFNKEKTAYIPVENHEVHLRELLTIEEAKEKIEKMPVFDDIKYRDLLDFTDLIGPQADQKSAESGSAGQDGEEQGSEEKNRKKQGSEDKDSIKIISEEVRAAGSLDYWKQLYVASLYMSEEEKKSLYEHAEIAYVLQNPTKAHERKKSRNV